MRSGSKAPGATLIQPDMSANASFSSSSNVSLHSPPPSSSSSLNSSSFLTYICLEVTDGSHVFIVFSCSYFLFFIPLCIFILHKGLWRKQRSASVASVTTNSLDLITCHTVAMEMIGLLGCCFYSASIHTRVPELRSAGIYLFNTTITGQALFHILTCAERYLAVVHPIFYLGLGKVGGVRVRNISIGLVWVLSFGWMWFTALYSPYFPTVPFLVLLSLSFTISCFFSLSVLRALIRPGPGQGVGDNRERVDQSKRRAFHTIAVITGTLLFRLTGQMICLLVVALAKLSPTDDCEVLRSGFWFVLPSSYVLPLLLLHRAGKLPCFKYNAESGRGTE